MTDKSPLDMTHDELMQALHDATAAELLDVIRNGVTDEAGKRHPAPATYLNVARQLLKDNGYRADPKTNKNLAPLAQEVPFPADEEGAYLN